MSGGHLEKIGRPVVLENVSGGHLKKKKKKKAPASSVFPQRQDAKHVCFFTSPYLEGHDCDDVFISESGEKSGALPCR